MIIQSNQIVLSSPFDLDLSEWTNAVIEKAIGEGFICTPWEPDDAPVDAVTGCRAQSTRNGSPSNSTRQPKPP